MSKLFIGVDVGTSSIKGLLVDEKGKILKEESVDHPIEYPQPGWTQQNPDDWLKGCKEVLKRLSAGKEKDIYGLSFGGQMHGLVILDDKDNVIRPAILWNDGRTEKQTQWLNNHIGQKKLSDLTGNIAFAGFTAPKLLWVKENEPQNYAKINKVMLPKDYVAYKLTGKPSCDYSDASGMLLLDVKNKKWSEEMCKICEVKMDWLPKLYESYEVVGKVLPESGVDLPNCVVTAGAGDNAAAAIGTGIVGDGSCNVSLGTSGTIFIAKKNYAVDEKNALHAFAHADGAWHVMGCILTAASGQKWWLEDILGTNDYAGSITTDTLKLQGKNTVFFAPYLMGERSPHNDVAVRGAFLGLDARTTRQEMSLAVLEGVSFALRECLEAAVGTRPTRTCACGGGARNKAWAQILANILGMPVDLPETEQGPAYGAALLAMVGAGIFKTPAEAAKALVKVKEVVNPNLEIAELYDTKFKQYKGIYPAIHALFTNE